MYIAYQEKSLYSECDWDCSMEELEKVFNIYHLFEPDVKNLHTQEPICHLLIIMTKKLCAVCLVKAQR